MLMCSPGYLFALPGLALTLLGLLAIPGAVLAGYGVYTKVFGPNSMYTASLLSIVGLHLLVFGFLAKLYTHQVDPVFQDPRVTKILSLFSIERGLAIGGGMMLLGAALGIPVLIHWARTLEVPLPGQWILAGTLFTLGVELVFASFLVGILDLPQERGRRG
jgi:hypothetical protein